LTDSLQDQKRFILIYVFLITALGLAVYANSLNGEFLWDDDYLIKQNIYIKNPARISKLFTEQIGAGSGVPSNSYRPLQMLTYMLDYSLWKLNVRGYHLVNMLLHILAALSLFWLINLLFKDRLLALGASLFFIAHPIQTEAVSYISGRADPLALLFLLLAFIFYLKRIKFMLFAFILALLSREASLIFPLLLLLYHFIFNKKFKLKPFLPILTVSFVYVVLRLTVLSFPLPIKANNVIPNAFQRLPAFFVAVPQYIRLLFLPFNLHMEYGQKIFSYLEPKAILGLIILSVLIIYAIRKRSEQRLVCFSIFWFLICLLPVSNIYFINAYMAEHWLYLPSIGFFLILAKGLTSLYKVERLRVYTICLGLSLLAFYSHLTIQQNRYWREPKAFYERLIKYAPDSQRVYLNLANIYLAEGDKEHAARLYKKTIELDPDYAEAYNNLAVIYCQTGKKGKALGLFKKALEINPLYADAMNNLANAHRESGRTRQAIALYKKAMAIAPNYLEPYVNLGIEYFRIGKQEEGLKLLKQAIAIDRTSGRAYINLAVAYFKQGKFKLAIKYHDRATKLGIQNPTLATALKPYR
jgi:tetratricopeptide (TPR) repeat protein